MDTQWFKDRLSDKRMSQRDLARRIGIDHSAISLMLRGKRVMKIVEAAQIAKLLGVPASEVMAHAGVRIDSAGALVSVAAWMDGTGEIHQIGESPDHVPSPSADLPDTAIAIQARTAMTPLEIFDGWLFFVSQPTGFDPAAVGRYSYVKVRGEFARLAYVKPGYRKGRWNLYGWSAQLQDVELEFATPVLMIQCG